jgi:hypothetical protein
MALYTVTSTTDLTTKGKRLGSIHASFNAAGNVKVNDGVGGTTRYQLTAAAAGPQSLVFTAPSLPVLNGGMSVVVSGAVVDAVTLDIY